MEKHLGLKAFVLLVVIFFHSFYLVPVGYAASMGVVVDIAVARQVFRSIAPSVVKATPAGRGYALAYFGVMGVGYLLVKSGAVTALKNWWDGTVGAPATDGTFWFSLAGTHRHVYYVSSGSAYGWSNWSNATCPGSWNTTSRTCVGSNFINGGYPYGTFNQAYTGAGGSGTPGNQPPSVPTDYGTQLLPNQPVWPDGSIFFSPGAAAFLNGANPVGPVTELTDADLDKMKVALGATTPDAQGNQPTPDLGDSNLSEDANATIPYLQQIMNYVSNLLGIKTDTGAIRISADNLVAGQSAQTSAVQQSLGKLDNIAIASQSMKNTMDNVGVAIQNQTVEIQKIPAKLDNVVAALNTTTVTQNNLSTRLSNVKTALLSKFPFSIVAAVTAPGAVTGGTYSIPDLHFPLGTTVSVDPMQNAQMASWIGWLRGLMATGMWAIFILVMVRRATQI